MKTGSVKFFNIKKGFGFITKEDGKDIFFHVTAVLKADGSKLIKPKDGDKVEFEIGDSEKGPCAINIKITN